MCTLTYFLHNEGYELFFNRDEQRSRQLALYPQYDDQINALYPIDPDGSGTWIAVNNKGLSLALLNDYQTTVNQAVKIKPNKTISRGLLILTLLKSSKDVIEQLIVMDLTVYQPFKLCIFPEDLSINKSNIRYIQWNGYKLSNFDGVLPITSSSVEEVTVTKERKNSFKEYINGDNPQVEHYKSFHLSTNNPGKYSVNMNREDAQTVSISHISVSHKINFNYYDNLNLKSHSVSCSNENKCSLLV
jgi:hypothetical protein